MDSAILIGDCMPVGREIGDCMPVGREAIEIARRIRFLSSADKSYLVAELNRSIRNPGYVPLTPISDAASDFIDLIAEEEVGPGRFGRIRHLIEENEEPQIDITKLVPFFMKLEGLADRAQIASSFSAFFNIIVRDRSILALHKACAADAHVVAAVDQRIYAVSSSSFDTRYAHPKDAAIAVYLIILNEFDKKLAKRVCEALPGMARSLSWARHAMERIIGNNMPTWPKGK